MDQTREKPLERRCVEVTAWHRGLLSPADWTVSDRENRRATMPGREGAGACEGPCIAGDRLRQLSAGES